MKTYNLVYKQFGESAILIEWPQKISKEILTDIRSFVEKIKKNNTKEILELNFVYSSLLIIYNTKVISFSGVKELLNLLYKKERNPLLSPRILWRIPVCYEEEFGIDLEFLAKEKQCSIEQIVGMHQEVVYTVYGIGFLPGFLYLGGLKKELITARRKFPRLDVPKGAIAIGGNQTGIYPQNTPGGWHIVGKTPITLFDVRSEIPCPISSGDLIRFDSISRGEFEVIRIAEATEVYEYKKEIYD